MSSRILVVSAFCTLWLIIFIRNFQVHTYRLELINKISERNLLEIRELKEFSDWRYKEYNKVSYDRMVWMFWKDLDSFYDLDNLLK